MSRKPTFAQHAALRNIAVVLIAGLAILLHASAAFAARPLPPAFSRPARPIIEEIGGGGGGVYDCRTEMAELMDRVGEPWNDLPQEKQDELMRALNRKWPCDGGGWSWLDDLGDFLENYWRYLKYEGGKVKDFGECLYDILSDADDFDYDTLADAFYENGDSCYCKENHRLDCSVRESRHADPDWSCVPASRFSGSCISSADLVAAFATSDQDHCLELDVDAELCEDESDPFDMTVYLTTSDVELDCNGRTITGMPGGPGIRTPYEKSVSDIRIRSCRIQDTDKYGIDLKRFFRGAELDGSMPGHRDISIEDTSITNPGNAGVYVGQNSRNVSLRDVEIRRADVAGVYLESGSTHTLVSGGAIMDTQEKSGGADPGAAIAIDSSQHNTIEGVAFEGNSGGDIKLYKNCGENYGQVCPIRRPLSASHNVIRFNEFNDDVSVASRQLKLNGPAWCAGIDVAGFWRDRASDNLIYSNRFQDSTLDVQDGPNKVCGNDFSGGELELGKPQPAGFIDRPVEIDGIVAENAFDAESTVDVQTLGVFDDLDFFDNRDPEGRCLALPDVCPGELSSYPESAYYEECLELRNECSERATSRTRAAAQACGVSTLPSREVDRFEVPEVTAPVGATKPTPPLRTRPPATRLPVSPRKAVISPRTQPAAPAATATPVKRGAKPIRRPTLMRLR